MAAMRFVFMTVMWLSALIFGDLTPAAAQQALPGSDGPHIASSLVPESLTPAAGARTTLAISMIPQPGWHGYWQTPGDSGFPLKATWTLPNGVKAGDPAYPVPGTLVIAGLMNHVYEKPYALLVSLDIPAGLAKGTKLPVSAKLDYLVCNPSICVPESATVSTTLTVGDGTADPASAARFAEWRKALPRPLGSPVAFEAKGGRFRLGVPLPATVALHDPHLFAVTDGAVNYAAPQSFARDGDMLIIETAAGPSAPRSFDGVLALGDGSGLSFTAAPGPVPAAGKPLDKEAPATGSRTLYLHPAAHVEKPEGRSHRRDGIGSRRLHH